MVATAVAVGAAAAMTETTKHAVTDAYTALKNLIARRYGSVDLTVAGGDVGLHDHRLVAGQRSCSYSTTPATATRSDPLLPDTPTCRVVITSRRQLVGHCLTLSTRPDRRFETYECPTTTGV